MSRMSDACERHPFSNGTEGEAWMWRWCEFCVHDHDISHAGANGDTGCDLILNAMLPEFPSAEIPWPEAWLPEPDDGSFALPSRMVCGQFSACTRGECAGDPGEAERAERMVEVREYWRTAS